MDIKLTEYEELCKYYYEHGLDMDTLLSGNTDYDVVGNFDIAGFKKDTLTQFARQIKEFNEDVIIPQGHDVMIAMHPRYMPTKKHAHEYIEFAYLVQGECTQYINDIPHEMKPGDIFLLAPGTAHCDESYSDDVIIFYIMTRKSTFDTAFLSLLGHNDILSSFFAQITFDNKQDSYLIFKTNQDTALQNLVYQMYKDSLEHDAYSARLINVQFEWFCLHLLKKHISHTEILDQNKISINVVEILSYIQDNFKTVDLDCICDRFSYSKGHIQRLIKKSTGYTFNEIVTKAKLKNACSLLHNNALTIQDIAGAVGFNDNSHFHRMFKKYIGLTPAEYRKERCR